MRLYHWNLLSTVIIKFSYLPDKNQSIDEVLLLQSLITCYHPSSVTCLIRTNLLMRLYHWNLLSTVINKFSYLPDKNQSIDEVPLLKSLITCYHPSSVTCLIRANILIRLHYWNLLSPVINKFSYLPDKNQSIDEALPLESLITCYQQVQLPTWLESKTSSIGSYQAGNWTWWQQVIRDSNSGASSIYCYWNLLSLVIIKFSYLPDKNHTCKWKFPSKLIYLGYATYMIF